MALMEDQSWEHRIRRVSTTQLEQDLADATTKALYKERITAELARREQETYSDAMDGQEQIDMEEQIAAQIFDAENIDEEVAAELGRQILKSVLLHFRPDLFHGHALRK